MFRRRALSLALAVIGLAGLSPLASAAAPTDAQALAAIQKVDPSITKVVESVDSTDASRAAVVAKPESGPAAGVVDLWLVDGAGNATSVTNNRATLRTAYDGISVADWSPDDRYLAGPVADPSTGKSTVFVWNVAGTPSVKATVPGANGGQFSVDGRYLAASTTDLQFSGLNPYTTFVEAALDLSTGSLWDGYDAYYAAGVQRFRYSSYCQRMDDPTWDPDTSARTRLVAALAEAQPRCVFPATGGSTPGPIATPTPTPAAVRTPAPTVAPVSTPKPGTTPKPQATPAPDAGVSIVSYVQSLKRARTGGLRVKVSSPGAAKLRVYLISPAGKTLARVGKASKGGAVVVVIKPTAAAKKLFKKVKSTKVVLTVFATTSAGVTTKVEQPLTLK
ncbi:MAG: hypothetical protein PGN13_12150 [Patulibacter minatonensis]